MNGHNPQRALEIVGHVETLCVFAEWAAENLVPVSMPSDPGSLFEAPTWVGLGIVGLWAVLDAFAERRGLPSDVKCSICHRKTCIYQRFEKFAPNERRALQELEDLRHLYAHNYAGQVDVDYLKWRRHVLRNDRVVLTVGAPVDGQSVLLNFDHLRQYAGVARRVLDGCR